MSGKIISIGTALPEHTFGQMEILEFMEESYNNDKDSRKLKALFHNSGINYRASALSDFGTPSDPSFFKHQKEQPSVDKRMEFFKDHGLRLAIESIHNTLNQVNTKLADVSHLITVTCTGLYAPGLNAQLIKHLKLREDIPHTAVNFMGCNAAFYAMKIADLIVSENSNAKVLIVCVELCTLHFQPKSSKDHLLSNTIFCDGAASVLIASKTSPITGLGMDGFYSLLMHEGWDFMGWNINPVSFEMILNTQIPSFIEKKINGIVEKSLLKYKIAKEEISHWGIHPGGLKILDVIKQQLSLDKECVKQSYDVLLNHGNMSSPTILFVLKSILEESENKGEKTFAIGFGPGLSIETSLLTYE